MKKQLARNYYGAPANGDYRVTLEWKLFHNSPQDERKPIGRCKASVKGGVVRLKNFELSEFGRSQGIATQLQTVVRKQVHDYLADTRYPYSWDEVSGIESYIRPIDDPVDMDIRQSAHDTICH